MLKKTKGIAFNFIKYKETSIIARIYTEEFGLKSFLINGVRSSRSRIKTGIFQPLTLLDLVIYYKENKDLYRISEVKCAQPFKSIPFDIRKSTTTLFLTEFLSKILREESADPALFNFLEEKIMRLDNEEMDPSFHIKFMSEFSVIIGLQPLSAEHLLQFSPEQEFTEEDKNLIQLLLTESGTPKIKKNARRRILQAYINFYGYHFEPVLNLKSLPVLQEVLS